ncbi:MAG TPA: arylsulfatase [Longimicrobiaceae bacterium]
MTRPPFDSPFTVPRLARALRRGAAALAAGAALAACAAPGAAPGARPDREAARPPNIVFIMADDLGWGDIEPNGQQKIHTPSLTRMASEGVRFTDFYSGSTVCAPARSVLMTGLHTGHTPIRGNREVLPIGQTPLPASAVTLAEVLGAAGYATGIFGKWGLGAPDTEGIPTRQGFDEFFGYLDQRRAHFHYPEWLWRNEERVPLPNETREARNTVDAGWAITKGEHSHDRIASEALSFIDRHRSEPFFLYLAITLPHADIDPPADAFAPYVDAQGRSIFPETPFPGAHYSPQSMPHAAFAAMVTRMDRDVGRVLDRLRELGIDDNTIVFFTSDNGPTEEGGADPEFFDSNGPFRGVKRDLYDGGIRVPMIAWAPGRFPAGAVSDHVWAMWDVLPTLAELAGQTPPPGLDGLSMVGALTGERPAPTHDYLYWEFYERGSAQAVRMGNWKGVRMPMLSGPIELYDIAADPGETEDLAARHPEIVARIRDAMAEAHRPDPMWQPPRASLDAAAEREG